MKAIVTVFCLAVSVQLFSQTRNIKVNITLFSLTNDNIELALNSQVENLDHCSIKVSDSANKIVKSASFPKAISKPGIKQWTQLNLPLTDLTRGTYTYTLFLGKEEMYKKDFRKN